MIDYIRGQLVALYPGKAVVEMGGVAFALDLATSGDLMSEYIGKEIKLYTRLLIREDEIFIYGFRAAEERKLFNLVLGVSGFGPRLALSLLSVLSVSQFYVAVIEENIAQLCRAHGVGRKAAQRLVLELKEKLPNAFSGTDIAVGTLSPTGSAVIDDIVEALSTLGYSPAEAVTAANRVYETNNNAGREELLKLALKNLGGL